MKLLLVLISQYIRGLKTVRLNTGLFKNCTHKIRNSVLPYDTKTSSHSLFQLFEDLYLSNLKKYMIFVMTLILNTIILAGNGLNVEAFKLKHFNRYGKFTFFDSEFCCLRRPKRKSKHDIKIKQLMTKTN